MIPPTVRDHSDIATCKNPVVAGFPWNSAVQLLDGIDRCDNYYRESPIVFTSLNSVSANYALPPERCRSLKEFPSSLLRHFVLLLRNANFLECKFRVIQFEESRDLVIRKNSYHSRDHLF